MPDTRRYEVIIVGGGLAGLSAAIYLGRSKRQTLLVDSGRSMARWEPNVQNYLGFPNGISGVELLARARRQARRYGVQFVRDEIISVRKQHAGFFLHGKTRSYACARLLLATGSFHIPPEIPGVKPCLGRSLFFCKDCDGYRVQGRNIGVYGWRSQTVEYAMAMLTYSQRIAIFTDGRKPHWSQRHENWRRDRCIPVYREAIRNVRHRNGKIEAVIFHSGAEMPVQAIFTARGDFYFSKLAQELGARVNKAGEIVVGVDMRTTLSGLYAAGCVTPANCQMIIAAGQGATVAQAINRDLFEGSLAKTCPVSHKGKLTAKMRRLPTSRRRKTPFPR